MVINALAAGQLETKRATALLYGLQLASSNACRLTPTHTVDVVRRTRTTSEGLDLAEPATYQPMPFNPDEEEEEDGDYA